MREFYHTQEKRKNRLTQPIFCDDEYAWLGDGYYFWYDLEDAHFWGNKKKRKTGFYEIYSANIDYQDGLFDTVFNEDQYNHWLKWIEQTAKKLTIKNRRKPNLKELNNCLKEKGFYKNNKINGILFQDNPEQKSLFVENFFYRKRIQLVIYDISIIHNFKFYLSDRCIYV